MLLGDTKIGDIVLFGDIEAIRIEDSSTRMVVGSSYSFELFNGQKFYIEKNRGEYYEPKYFAKQIKQLIVYCKY